MQFAAQANLDFRRLEIPNLTFSKMEEAYRMSTEIVANLDEPAIKELSGGYETDVQDIYDCILEETFNVLYGEKGTVEESSVKYLEKLADSMEETLRVESLAYFITSVLPDFKMNWHHLEWCQFVHLYSYLCTLASRGIGKSHFFSNAYIAWKMYRYKAPELYSKYRRRDLELSKRGFIFSFSMNQVKDLIEILKDTIENNDVLRQKLFPRSRAEGWAKEDIKCANGARLTGRSFGTSVRGAHPGYIVIDDPLTDAVLYSEIQRQKNIRYFHAVIMNMPLKGGQVCVVGTPFHNLDLYGDLKMEEKRGMWYVFEYPGLFPDGTILWADQLSYEQMMQKKATQGNLIFSREILCKPITSDSTIFPYEILRRSLNADVVLVKNRESYKIKFDRVVVGCDFAMSSSVGADYTVFTTWGIDSSDRMWLMNIYRKKGASFGEQMAALKRIDSEFRPDVIMAESNQFQMIFVQEADKAGLPVFPHNTGTNKYNLEQGLPGVAILFERSKIVIPYGDVYSKNQADLMFEEFSSVAWTEKGLEGVGAHDDIPSSTWQGAMAKGKMTSGFDFLFLD